MSEKFPFHFTQVFKQIDENEIEFFDLNLAFDSRLFIDPFLLKKSSINREKELFERFGDFFRFAYDQSLGAKTNQNEIDKLKRLLTFHEQKEVGLGYTENSNDGSGPGSTFANNIFNFFLNNSAKVLVKEHHLYPNGKFDPKTLEIFIDGLGPDGISDITANLIIDYLIEYTQEICAKHGIKTKTLPVDYDGFDFEDMDWHNGGYHDLPENPNHEGQAIILVPKRLLRANHNTNEEIHSKIKDILNSDPVLTERFSDFLTKNVSEFSTEDIRNIILQENSVLKKYLELLGKEDIKPYNFGLDNLSFLSIKKYSTKFKDLKVKPIQSGELLERVFEFIDVFKEEVSEMDGWKDMWVFENNVPVRSQQEVSAGRILRGIGFAYFRNFKDVSFIPECGSGNGKLDYYVVFKNEKIAIELKKIDNSSHAGKSGMPAYLHGICKQLPDYINRLKANYGIYLTLQHWSMENRPTNHHNDRVDEIKNKIAKIDSDIRLVNKYFKSLHYINIKVTPKPTAAKL